MRRKNSYAVVLSAKSGPPLTERVTGLPAYLSTVYSDENNQDFQKTIQINQLPPGSSDAQNSTFLNIQDKKNGNADDGGREFDEYE